ncbi:MAG: hypothetical protein R2715_08595 [Ilumatobacteraceae bacterium]
MTAGELAVLLAAVLCTIGFAGLVVVLLRVLDSTKALGGQVEGLHREVELLRNETRPLLAELRDTVDDARVDLDRFDRVLGSAEAISDAVAVGGNRISRAALSAPVIKSVALVSGTGRAGKRLRRGSTDRTTR